jgi:hypothetical protein
VGIAVGRMGGDVDCCNMQLYRHCVPLSDVRSSLVVCITYHRMIKNLSHSSKGSCLNSTSHFGIIKGILLHLYKLLTGRIKLVG